jgi:Na+-driven multidrug efflux pump
MKICAVAMPLDAFAHASYFTLRAGGRIVETVLFDSGFVWAVNVTIAFVLSRFTGAGILAIFAICQFTGIIRCVICTLLVKKGIWIKNIVE